MYVQSYALCVRTLCIACAQYFEQTSEKFDREKQLESKQSLLFVWLNIIRKGRIV